MPGDKYRGECARRVSRPGPGSGDEIGAIGTVCEFGEFGDEGKVGFEKLYGVRGIFHERVFSIGVAGQEVPVDAVAFGSVDSQGCVIILVCVSRAGCPSVCFFDNLDLFGAAASLEKVVNLECQAEMRRDADEVDVFGQDRMALDEILARAHPGLHI